MRTEWERIESGDLNEREAEALRVVAAQEPVILCRVRREVRYWTLRDLALAGPVEMRDVDGERTSPWDIEFAVTGGWLGVVLTITDAGPRSAGRCAVNRGGGTAKQTEATPRTWAAHQLKENEMTNRAHVSDAMHRLPIGGGDEMPCCGGSAMVVGPGRVTGDDTAVTCGTEMLATLREAVLVAGQEVSRRMDVVRTNAAARPEMWAEVTVELVSPAWFFAVYPEMVEVVTWVARHGSLVNATVAVDAPAWTLADFGGSAALRDLAVAAR